MKATLFLLLAFAATALQAQYSYKNLATKTELSDEELKPYTYENLRIYPIYAKESFINYNSNIGKYTPLKEALEKQKVKITETSEDNSREQSPTVNTLYIQNLSADTVYLMGGEVVKGGRQDRVIAEDVVLPPKSKKMNLSVFCVEHGRWTPNEDGKGDEFSMTYTVTSSSVRKAAEVQKNQTEVWGKVAEVTDKNKTSTSTGTYTSLGNSKDYNTKLNSYVNYFKNQLAKEKNVIGFVAVTGNKVIGCDMFATSVLFNQQLDNLLRSYATEAITNGDKITIKNAAVKDYLDKLLLNESARPNAIEKDGKEFKKGDKTLHITMY